LTSLWRKAASYWPRPRPRSQPPISHGRAPLSAIRLIVQAGTVVSRLPCVGQPVPWEWKSAYRLACDQRHIVRRETSLEVWVRRSEGGRPGHESARLPQRSLRLRYSRAAHTMRRRLVSMSRGMSARIESNTSGQNQTLRIREITGIPQVLAIFAGTKRQILSTSSVPEENSPAIIGTPGLCHSASQPAEGTKKLALK
jgi:hypothetical protein